MISIRWEKGLYAAALMTDGALYTYACPGYHAALHVEEEVARRWLSDHGLRKSKARKLLAAAIRGEGEFADEKNLARIVNEEFQKLAGLGLERCYSRPLFPKISQMIAGYSIDDVRDLDVRLVMPELDRNGELAELLARFKLRNYRGPVCTITVTLQSGQGLRDRPASMALHINMAVISTDDGKPTIVTLTETRTYEDFLQRRGATHQFALWLREMLHRAHTHELDESLLLDDEHVINPHPERKPRPNERLGGERYELPATACHQ